jgi:hydroxymethylpyrimidine/phosphomethylpyrimidine kinase
METPVAVTIAGSDNSGGAGIQADLKTFTHFEVYAQTVITCVVAEVPGKVCSIQAIEPEVIRDQLHLSLTYFPVRAIKTGMLYSREIIAMVCNAFEALPQDQRPFLVVDPVMVAASGHPLVQSDAIEQYRSRLFPLANLITPNLDEAATILATKLGTFRQMRAAATELYEKFRVPFLLKGGHLKSAEAVDLLIDGDGTHQFSEPYQYGIQTHGTGCAYSAAIAANVALGLTLREAVGVAKTYITHAIRDSYHWKTRAGAVSALRHFWSKQPASPRKVE